MWSVNPEIRWYVEHLRRWYVGVSGLYGSPDMSSGPIYKALDFMYGTEHGYKGDFYGGGLVLGYQVYLSRSFSIDLNVGGGYTHANYDAFSIVNDQRVYSGRDLDKDLWGLTQTGVSLVWKIGK
jgi:hypothetical protein